MAKRIQLTGLLRFRESKPEPKTERADRKTDTVPKPQNQTPRELPPFQRVRLGSDCYLAAEVIPIRGAVN